MFEWCIVGGWRLFLGAVLCVFMFGLFWFPGKPKPGVATVAEQALSDGRLGERNLGERKEKTWWCAAPCLERGASFADGSGWVDPGLFREWWSVCGSYLSVCLCVAGV